MRIIIIEKPVYKRAFLGSLELINMELLVENKRIPIEMKTRDRSCSRGKTRNEILLLITSVPEIISFLIRVNN